MLTNLQHPIMQVQQILLNLANDIARQLNHCHTHFAKVRMRRHHRTPSHTRQRVNQYVTPCSAPRQPQQSLRTTVLRSILPCVYISLVTRPVVLLV